MSNRSRPVVAALLLVVGACSTPTATDADGSEQPEAALSAAAGTEGAGGGTRLDELAASPSDDRNEQLAEMAREAGPVLVYSSNPPEEFDRVTEAFTDEYGVEVENYRAGGTDLIQRVLQESSAGAATADVISANDNVVYALDAGEGLVRSFQSAEAEQLPDELQVSENSYPVYVNYWMWAYNTDLVTEEELPRTYEDLLDPAWQGRVTIAQYADWFATMFEIVEQPEDYFIALGEQGPLVADQFTPALLPVVSGEHALTITTTSGALAQQQAAGAPVVGYFPDDPTVARSQSVGWLDGGSNPAGGMLFAEFLLSPEDGQQFMREANRVPAHVDVEADPPELRAEEFVTVDYETFLPEQADWEERFDTLLIGG